MQKVEQSSKQIVTEKFTGQKIIEHGQMNVPSATPSRPFVAPSIPPVICPVTTSATSGSPINCQCPPPVTNPKTGQVTSYTFNSAFNSGSISRWCTESTM